PSFGSRRLTRLPTPAEQSDHLAVEGRDVVRFAARHEVVVNHDLLVYPLGASVLEIRLDRRPCGDPPPARRAGLDDGPGAMADRRHRLAGVEEGLPKLDRLPLHPELVTVHDA